MRHQLGVRGGDAGGVYPWLATLGTNGQVYRVLDRRHDRADQPPCGVGLAIENVSQSPDNKRPLHDESGNSGVGSVFRWEGGRLAPAITALAGSPLVVPVSDYWKAHDRLMDSRMKMRSRAMRLTIVSFQRRAALARRFNLSSLVLKKSRSASRSNHPSEHFTLRES
jgi:hypothetical protein